MVALIPSLSFSAAAQTNTSVTWLELERCKPGDDGVALLADAMRSNRSIKNLSVAHNDMTDVGMAALAASIDVSAD